MKTSQTSKTPKTTSTPKTRHVTLTFAAGLLLVATTPAEAKQDQAQPAPDPAPTSEATPPPPATPAAPNAEAAAQLAPQEPAGTGDSLESRLTKVEGTLEGMNEANSANQATLDKLNRIKVGGYVQGRYEYRENSDFGVDVGNNNAPREFNRFFVRRGRVKTTYAGDYSEFVLQVDATGDGVVLKDAEASLVLDNTAPLFASSSPWELKLTFGQFNTPFGFEIAQSSSVRELPERTSMFRALYPGERDRGVRLQYTYSVLRLWGGLINGNGTQDPIYRATDQTSWKDFVGRAGLDLGWIVFGGSWHLGRTLDTRLVPARGTTPATAEYARFDRKRFGGDAQLYFHNPIGNLTVRGEVIWAKDRQISFAGADPDPNGCRDREAFGFYATASQNLGKYLGLALRYDQYDPRTKVNSACDQAVRDAVAQDEVSTLGVALLGYISGNLKATLAYEHLAEHEKKKKDNDIVTLQMQAKF